MSTPQPSPARELGDYRAAKKERTRRSLGMAALELFEVQGYEHTTTEQIAQRAQVSRPTFFRYFEAKEDVLFWDDLESVEMLRRAVADRTDRRHSLAALSEPVALFARIFGEQAVCAERRAALIMTTPALENRSLRVRQQWEKAVALQLAAEAAETLPSAKTELLADITTSCYLSSLRRWRHDSSAPLSALVSEAFCAARVLAGTS